MAPSKKSRTVNMRFSYINEVTSSKNGDNASKSKQRKRKLSDMLGPQWSKEELERFYRAYRKHGNDWGKVAVAVHDRSVEMVEALYTMNKVYLSLPKGYASAAGLIAMMTDHYNNLEESDSEQETNRLIVAPRKLPKRARGTKESDVSQVPDLLQSQSAASNYGCLSLLKKRRSGSRPWAVGKRTPRFPVSYSFDKDSGDKYISPIRQGLKFKADALDDDVAHEIALVLTEASQRTGSPQVSQTPNRKIDTPSPVRNGEKMHAESEMTSAKLYGSEMDEGGCELSLGSTEADIGHYAREKRFWKGKRYNGKKPDLEENVDSHLEDIKEACSGTEEGQKQGATKGKLETEVAAAGAKFARSSNKGPRKRSRKVLFGEGEADEFDALQALADLSLRLPEAPVDTESSVHVEEPKTGIVPKSKLRGSHSIPGVKVASKTTKQGKVFAHDVSAIQEVKDGAHQINVGIRERRKKSLPSKILENEEHIDSHLGESQKVEATEDVNGLIKKAKYSRDTAYQKQGKLMKPSEFTSSADHGRESNNSAPSSVQVLSSNQFNLPTKVRSRRKINTQKPLIDKDILSPDTTVNGQHNIAIPSYKESRLKLKKKLSNCLSWHQARRWCVCEFFYSAIDYPWFAKREFVEYLDHVGLAHIPRLTHVEWGVIRSSLGKPRRFSEQFLKEEKEKLNQYRESVRNHYSELRAGTRDGLPTDLARPLAVGQRIIALHPKTWKIHDGSVLTVDHNRCRVQFDQPEIGVEFVMDVECMPLNPSENMPASLNRHKIFNNFIENLNGLKMNGQSIERKMEGYIKFAPSENQENANGLPHISPSTHHINNLLQHTKGSSANCNAQISIESSETIIAQQAVISQPSILAHIQAKEADIQALSEFTRALDKKEAVVSEMKRMNDEVESQKDRENSLKDSELFKKHYAAVLLQLNEVNEQVSSALFCLRQRNTYQGNSPHMWLKPMTSIGEPVGHCSPVDHSAYETQESGSHLDEILESSRANAQKMVDVAMQAVSSLKKEGSSIESIEEAIDFVNNQLSVDDLSTPAIRSSTPANFVQSTLASQYQLSSRAAYAANVGANIHAPDADLDCMSDQNGQIPSELITKCIATLLMIQKCTERQFPPSDIAEVLESAVTSLKPCCSQNLPIYADIQKCMGIIRNQILALIPT